MPPLDDHYADWILPHANSSRHRAEPAAGCTIATARNPTCGDEVQLAMRVDPEGNLIQSAHCTPRGCLISQAAASSLCEHLIGRSLTEARQRTAQQMLTVLPRRLSLRERSTNNDRLRT